MSVAKEKVGQAIEKLEQTISKLEDVELTATVDQGNPMSQLKGVYDSLATHKATLQNVYDSLED